MLKTFEIVSFENHPSPDIRTLVYKEDTIFMVQQVREESLFVTHL